MKTLFKSTLLIVFMFLGLFSYAQKQTNVIKGQVALGFNRPLWRGFVQDLNSQNINFPTVNLGIQYMFKEQLGAKVDFGFNRFANGEGVPEFKVNYSRFNAQFVYDPSSSIGFLPRTMRFVLHAGPGVSFVRPLGGLQDNNQTYLNFILGTELHYAIGEKMSIYGDLSYIHGFTSLDTYDPPISGLGAFNSGVVTATLGISFSISGCNNCYRRW